MQRSFFLFSFFFLLGTLVIEDGMRAREKKSERRLGEKKRVKMTVEKISSRDDCAREEREPSPSHHYPERSRVERRGEERRRPALLWGVNGPPYLAGSMSPSFVPLKAPDHEKTPPAEATGTSLGPPQAHSHSASHMDTGATHASLFTTFNYHI